MKTPTARPGAGCFLALLIAVSPGFPAAVSAAEPVVVFSTGFEAAEGYQAETPLVGQNGWTSFGAEAGNGIVTNFFEGLGQQAYIGFGAPAGTNEFISVYRPLNLAPIPPSTPVVTFSVLMQITDASSTNGPWDDFRWSVYNTEAHRLFTLDFDNSALLISYGSDTPNAEFISTGVKFDNAGYYELIIEMNFARNLWTATLNGEVIVHAQPVTTVGAALNLGDIDAVWAFRRPGGPGDNFMIFDEYTITAKGAEPGPARLEPLGVTPGGTFQARIYGDPGRTYRIEASSDLRNWTPLLTFTAPTGGTLDFQDPGAAAFAHRLYRVQQAP